MYAVARSAEGLAETASRVHAAGGKCVQLVVDLSDDDAVERLWARFNGQHPVDLVVNCACSAVDALKTNWRTTSWRKSPTGKDEKERPGAFWDVVNGVGLRAVYIGSVYALRHFAAHNDGTPRTLVNVSSAGGLLSLFDAALCTGKSGVDRLTSELAGEAPPGVTVLTSTEKFSEVINNPKNNIPVWNAESPLFVGRALAYTLPKTELMRTMHGKIVLTAKLAKKVDAVDEKGYRPLSFRSLRFLCAFCQAESGE